MKPSAGTRLAWAIGRETPHGFHVRRVVWGKLLASYEKRKGEKIMRVVIMRYERPS